MGWVGALGFLNGWVSIAKKKTAVFYLKYLCWQLNIMANYRIAISLDACIGVGFGYACEPIIKHYV